MNLGFASFPVSVWDGLYPTNDDRLDDVNPNFFALDRVTSEIVSVEQYLFDRQSIFDLFDHPGNAGSFLSVNNGQTGLIYRDIVAGAGIDLNFTDDELIISANAVSDHGTLTGLLDDDHTQYHNDARGDVRYYQKIEFITTSNGDTDAGKPIVLDSNGNIDASMINDGDVDHGNLAGLLDDDHTQYILVDGTRTLTGNLSVVNLITIDGRDLSVDGNKLDGIEAGADITDANNVAAAGAAMAGGAFHDGFSDFVAAEHLSHPNTITNTLTDHNLAAHTSIGLQEVISTNQTYYLATTGSDETGNGSSGNPWLTISKVWSYLASYRVNSDVTITIQLADGTYSYATSTLKHSDYITSILQGTNTYDKTMSSVQSSSGGSGAWSIIINLNNVTNIAVNDYVIILTASGGTNPNLMVGCHKVTNVDSGNNRITVTSLSLSASVPSGNVTCTITVLKSILLYTATHGLIFIGPQGATVKNLCIVNTVNTNIGIGSRAGASVTINKVGLYIAICAISDFGLLTASSTNFAVSGAYYGINASYKGVAYLVAGNFAITGCPGAGVLAQTSGYCDFRGCYISGNTIGTQAATAGFAFSLNNFYTSNATQTSPAINTQGVTMNFIASGGDTFI